MGFLGSIGKGLSQAATGGDGQMNLADYLKLAAMAGSVATGNVPGAIALGTSYAGDATGIDELKTVGDIGSVAVGGVGAVNALSGAAGAAQAGAGAAEGIGAVAEGVKASEAAVSPLLTGSADVASQFSQGTGALTGGAEAAMPTLFQSGGDIGSMLERANDPSISGESGLKAALRDSLGGSADERWENISEMAGDLSALAEQNPEIAPQGSPMEWSEQDITEFLSSLPGDLSSFLQLGNQGATPSPYASQYLSAYQGG